MMKGLIYSEIKNVVTNLYPDKEGIVFDVTASEKFGDYASNVAMVLDNDNAKEIAENIKKELISSENLKKHISNIEVAGAGFLNFVLNDDAVMNMALEADFEPNNANSRTILVEYGQENIAKPMTVGHLRSNIIGQSLVNIFEFLGEKVVSDNHLGDWGTQFGKLIVAYKKWGDRKKIEKDSVQELNALYVLFHKESKEDESLEDEARAEFKKLEDGDEENTKLWNWIKEKSLEEFSRMHKRLGVKFDHMHSESFFKESARDAINELIDKKIAVKNDDGSVMVEFPEEFSPSPLLIQKSDGSTLYSARDLATIKFYLSEFNPDLVLQCVGSEQSLYFRQVYDTAKRAGWIKEGKFVHVENGLVRLPEGKMSTREGRVVGLEELLDESEKRISDILKEKGCGVDGGKREELVKTLGVGAVIFSDLGQSRESNVTFSWEKALSFDGYSAPYLQYTYARANSILKKEKDREIEFDSFFDPMERRLAIKLIRFREMVKEASEGYHPHIVARYLFELAQVFNNFYQSLPVLSAEKDEKQLRLALVKKTADVLKKGLSLLGIGTPERM